MQAEPRDQSCAASGTSPAETQQKKHPQVCICDCVKGSAACRLSPEAKEPQPAQHVQLSKTQQKKQARAEALVLGLRHETKQAARQARFANRQQLKAAKQEQQHSQARAQVRLLYTLELPFAVVSSLH